MNSEYRPEAAEASPLTQLKSELCVYDPRHPDYKDIMEMLEAYSLDHDVPMPKAAEQGCACDNCFYGRHGLADLALRLMEQVAGLTCANVELAKKVAEADEFAETAARHILLSEFEAWCNGVGRGGKAAGVHHSCLNHIQSFKNFMQERHHE